MLDLTPDQFRELGYRAELRPGFTGGARYLHSRGMGLWGYRDINLDDSRSFTLAHEDRPFFGEPGAIVERTGATSLSTCVSVGGASAS